MKSAKYALPLLTRTTAWSAERVAALPQALEVRQLLENAERLGETELAAICNADLTRRRREALQARKLVVPVRKPKAQKKAVEEV
jgi:hypothetical protein